MRKISLSILFIAIGLAGLYVWKQQNSTTHDGIVIYQGSRDRASVLPMFLPDWNLLMHGATPKEYSIAHLLDTASPTQDFRLAGKLQQIVYREHAKTVGYCSYYMKAPTIGRVLFLIVDPTARRKGYAEKLVRFAVNDLVNRLGAKIVDIMVFSHNARARNLYEKLGFKIHWIDQKAGGEYDIIHMRMEHPETVALA